MTPAVCLAVGIHAVESWSQGFQWRVAACVGSQGRKGAATCMTHTLMQTPTGKTFELRRSEARDGRGKAMGDRAWQQLFLGLSLDRHRARAGLLPFPKAVPPPPPPSEDRTKVHTPACTTFCDVCEHGARV